MKRKSATTIAADDKFKSAFRLIGKARMVLTLPEPEAFISANLNNLGSRWFVGTVGRAMIYASSIDGAE